MEAKKKSDDDQAEIEELEGARRRQDKEMEALKEHVEALTAENQKTLRSKKKLQEEVGSEGERGREEEGEGCGCEGEREGVGVRERGKDVGVRERGKDVGVRERGKEWV